MTRLDAELRGLVDGGVLTQEQADRIRTAAREQTGHPGGSVLTEVLGYVGGILLLSAVALLVSVSWNDLQHAERTAVTAGAAVILLGAAVILERAGKRELASALAALGAGVTGFAVYVVVEHTAGRVSGTAVAVVLAAVALWWLGGTLPLVALAAALGVGVFELVYDVGDPNGERTDTAGWSGLGFLVVASVMAVIGLTERHRTTAWTLAGTAVFVSAVCWLVQDGTPGMALVVGTTGAVALLVAYAKLRPALYLVVACVTMLVVWPVALYQITDNVAAVAIALAVASGLLVTTVVVLSRRSGLGSGAADAADSRG